VKAGVAGGHPSDRAPDRDEGIKTCKSTTIVETSRHLSEARAAPRDLRRLSISSVRAQRGGRNERPIEQTSGGRNH